DCIVQGSHRDANLSSKLFAVDRTSNVIGQHRLDASENLELREGVRTSNPSRINGVGESGIHSRKQRLLDRGGRLSRFVRSEDWREIYDLSHQFAKHVVCLNGRFEGLENRASFGPAPINNFRRKDNRCVLPLDGFNDVVGSTPAPDHKSGMISFGPVEAHGHAVVHRKSDEGAALGELRINNSWERLREINVATSDI